MCAESQSPDLLMISAQFLETGPLGPGSIQTLENLSFGGLDRETEQLFVCHATAGHVHASKKGREQPARMAAPVVDSTMEPLCGSSRWQPARAQKLWLPGGSRELEA